MKQWSDVDLLNINLYECDETNVTSEQHRIVHTRKAHTCVGCKAEFPAGTRMRCDSWLNKETGSFDTLYYCVPCLVEDEDEECAAE